MNLFAAKSYANYFFTARHRKGYGIHSPFLFDLITKGLRTDLPKSSFSEIESLRKALINSKEIITVNDPGAGSKKVKTPERKISQIARTSLTRPKYARLLAKLIRYFKPNQMLELGTSLGITTLYMASAGKTEITTVEGVKNIGKTAQENFEKLQAENIRLIISDFSEALGKLNETKNKFDLVFIDGNHRYDATLDYFEKLKSLSHNNSILIFDDIHWSDGMHKAWQTIVTDKAVTLSLDIFQFGIVFFKKELSKQHFVLRY